MLAMALRGVEVALLAQAEAQCAQLEQAALVLDLQPAGLVVAILLHAAQAGPEDVLAADGMIFATPENLAAMSGLMKDFFDRSYYAVLDRVNGRPYACLVCAGSDGRNAARQIERICTGWRLRLVADALIVCTHAQTPDDILREKRIDPPDLERCTALGAAFGAGLAMGIY